MDKRGFIDKAITGWFALVVLFFAMALFVVISLANVILGGDNLGVEKEGIDHESIDSRVLMELYLNDEIDSVKVEELLAGLDRDSAEDAISAERLFEDKYSCGNNILVVTQLIGGDLVEVGAARTTSELITYINYPLWKVNETGILSSEGSSDYPTQGEYPEFQDFKHERYYTKSLGNGIRISIMEKIRC